jgi:hypothetical protein
MAKLKLAKLAPLFIRRFGAAFYQKAGLEAGTSAVFHRLPLDICDKITLLLS